MAVRVRLDSTGETVIGTEDGMVSAKCIFQKSEKSCVQSKNNQRLVRISDGAECLLQPCTLLEAEGF